MTPIPQRAHDESPAQVPTTRREREELVGRDRELSVIGGVIAAAADSDGACLLLSGEPGIGKTRLLRSAADLATGSGVAVAWGHIWPDVGAPPLWPWIQVLRAIVGDLTGRDPVRAGPGAPHVAALVPELGAVLADRDEFDGTVEHADFYLRDALVTLLCAAARNQPHVILLDDLHCADAASLHVAEHLAKATRGAPLCLIGSQRDESPGDASGDALARFRSVALPLRLQGLTPDQCRELASVRLGQPVPSSAARTLFERTGGNPLFLEEVVRGGLDRPGAVAAPARSVLRERLDGLDPAAREVLEIASVAGTVFSPELLARVAGVEHVASHIAALVEAGLVEHTADARVAFRHALLSEAAYDRLAPPRRAELHRTWAETLVEAWPLATDHPAVIAGHLLAALPLANAADARRWATRAAHDATDRLAHDDAADWYERALRAFGPGGPDDAEHSDLLLAFGRSLIQGTGTVRAMVAFEGAATAAERAGDELRRLEALVWLNEARYRAPGVHLDEAARVTLTAALEASTDAPPGLAARAAEQLARVETFRGTSERAYAVAQRALASARWSGDAEAVSAAHRALRWALVGPFGMDEKREASRLLVGALGRRSHPRDWWREHSWMLLDALEQGDRATVEAEVQSCRRLADELREPYLSTVTAAWETAVALLEGRFNEAEQMVLAGLEAAESSGVNAGGLYGQLACLAWERGESASCIDLLRGVANAVPDRSSLYRAFLASAYAEHGRVEEATFELDRLAVDGFAHVPRDGDWLTALCWCATACTRLDRPETARELRPLLLPFRDRGVVVGGQPFLFCGAVSLSTGALAVTAGDPDVALDDLADARAFHERLRARPWVANTLFQQGRAWRARGAVGDAKRAEEAFTTVQREAETLGMAALAARAASLAEQRPTPRPTVRREDSGWQVAFTTSPFHLQDCKGLRSLHHLLARPGVSVPATDLVTNVLGDLAADPERARVNVTRQLRTAIDRIADHDPDLGAHLRSAVTTGRACAYRPAGEPPRWRLR